MHFLFFALALSVQQAPQTPPTGSSAPEAPAAAAAQTPAPAEDSEDRIVCRREHVVGSNRRQQVCMTVRQRAELRDESRRQADRTGRGNDQQHVPVHPVSGM
jgi:pyruvate/2-oxoglutarate dehydrogenase complex dihydrolipoamide acyltransferase (E2) component